jgi:ribosomal protein L24E
VNTVPDKCPFCESPIMSHVGNLLVSEDGSFATYKCKTLQDIMWSDDQWKRTGQSDGCRKREIQLLTKRLDKANDRIKRLEEAGDRAIENSYYPDRVKVWRKAKEAKP